MILNDLSKWRTFEVPKLVSLHAQLEKAGLLVLSQTKIVGGFVFQ
jgi:hypothetical protein